VLGFHTDYESHAVALVPYGGHLVVLDGLAQGPAVIGKHATSDWIRLAIETFIATRDAQETNSLMYQLVAVYVS